MNSRLVLGFLFAPLIPCILFAVTMSALANQWSGLAFIIVAMIAVSEALTLVLAVPLYFVVKRFRTIGLVECVLSGVAVTVIYSAVALLLPVGPGYSAADGGGATIIDGHYTAHGIVSAMVGTAVQSTLGAGIGLFFWLIAIRGEKHGA